MPEPHAADPLVDAAELLESLPCGVFSFMEDRSIVEVNAQLLRMLGYDRAEVLGRNVEMLLSLAGRIFFQTHLYPLVRLEGRAEELFVPLRRKDGGEVGVLLNAARQQRAGRAVTDCVVMEARERRKFEDALLRAKQDADAAYAALAERTRELEQARATADEANQAKSQFLAVMSHELRTPLNAIGGYVQLLELGIHGPVTDAQMQALKRVSGAQRHLLRLINEVLNLARIESGRLEYTCEDVAVADLVAAVIPMLEPQMRTGKLTSITAVPPNLVAHVDREKTQQILINLLTNAVKFTPAGGTIAISAMPEDAGGHVLVRVKDTGIGIASDKLGSIFEPFVQVETGHTRRKEGTGLGLAISRDLALGMGGDLHARSAEGEGSTFTLVLPAGHLPGPSASPQGR